MSIELRMQLLIACRTEKYDNMFGIWLRFKGNNNSTKNEIDS